MIDVTKMRNRLGYAAALVAAITAVATLAQSPTITWTRVAAGLEHAHIRRDAPGDGLWNIHLLRVDMTYARLDVIRARDAAIGLETVSSMAKRVDAIAAVNGGYFRTSGDFLGDSTGTIKIDGTIWSEPDRERAGVGILRQNGASRLIFGHIGWDASLAAAGQKRTINGVNRARGANDLVVFTPQFGAATATDTSGVEVIVRDDRVVDVRDKAGATTIPRDGVVVSARGEARAWVRRHLTPGTTLTIRMGLRPADEELPNRWFEAEDVLGAGPKLVTAGRVDVTDVRERMIPSFAGELHPRTAIGALGDGRALLLVADGRRAPERVGLALDELARLLIELGATEAINLDGGGSSAMVLHGAVVNHPSDLTGERPVSDAIVVRGVE